LGKQIQSYKNLKFARVDLGRLRRKGFSEVVFCQGKTIAQVEKIVALLYRQKSALLLTRANKELFTKLKKNYPQLKYNLAARIIFRKKNLSLKKGRVLVITAGTSDIPVAEEARLTLEVMGNQVRCLYDCGVAGVHRILRHKKALDRATAIIVVAGMDGVLPSIVAGLTKRPVIAVPTSVGYGASFKGIAPLLTMLNCCAPGVSVVNIDNGFGAGYFASLLNR
jgi:NCAIR mutase (PurE)-related protein